MERKIRITRSQAGDEVVLERAKSAFGGISAMNVGGCQLDVDLLIVFHILTQCFARFIIQTMQFRRRTCFGEAFEKGLVCADDLWACTVFERFKEDGVSIIVVEEKQIAIARTGGKGKLASEIGVDLARFLDVGDNGV